MNKNAYSLIALLFASMAVFTSCGPDPDPDPAPDDSVGNSGWVISGFNWAESDECSVFNYDSYGRIIKEVFYQNGDKVVVTYKYTDNKIIMYDSGREDCFWDINSGLVRNYYDEVDEFAAYEYDSSRRLITISSDEIGYRFDFKWNSKKITMVTETRSSIENGSLIQDNRSYELHYGDNTSINRECIAPLNRLAMTFMFSLYPSVNLSGYFGEIPSSQLIIGHSGNYFGETIWLTYGNIDQNGCPRSIEYTCGDDTAETITLSWTKI